MVGPTPDSQQDLHAVARRFRRAIEEADLSRYFRLMAKYPLGCCRPTSQLFAKYLVTELRVPMVMFVSGRRANGQGWESHVWLQAGGNVIDLTGDQYPDHDIAAFVEPSSPFHETFTVQRTLPYGEMMNFSRDEGRRFHRMYRAVLRQLREEQKQRAKKMRSANGNGNSAGNFLWNIVQGNSAFRNLQARRTPQNRRIG